MTEKLNKASIVLHRGKNWIIAQAIAQYLIKLKPFSLAEEAKRQSMLASASSYEEDTIWEVSADAEHWK